MVSLLLLVAALAAPSPSQSVDQILQAYANAVGGQGAIANIHTRKAEISSRIGSHETLYWSAPNKVLLAGRHEKQGFDGIAGWEETKKKKVQKLKHGRQEELETDANPLRYVKLHDLYQELNADKPAMVDGVAMDVVNAPNSLGATRFFFDHETHLLVRIEEFGVTSAYYKHVILFEDYKELDGIRIPTRIRRESDEPGSEKGDLHFTRVEQNVQVDAALFRKPDIGPVTVGGRF